MGTVLSDMAKSRPTAGAQSAGQRTSPCFHGVHLPSFSDKSPSLGCGGQATPEATQCVLSSYYAPHTDSGLTGLQDRGHDPHATDEETRSGGHTGAELQSDRVQPHFFLPEAPCFSPEGTLAPRPHPSVRMPQVLS